MGAVRMIPVNPAPVPVVETVTAASTLLQSSARRLVTAERPIVTATTSVSQSYPGVAQRLQPDRFAEHDTEPAVLQVIELLREIAEFD